MADELACGDASIQWPTLPSSCQRHLLPRCFRKGWMQLCTVTALLPVVRCGSE